MDKGKFQQNIHKQWEASMTRRQEELQASIRRQELALLALRCGGDAAGSGLVLDYWDRSVRIEWPDLRMVDTGLSQELGLFDQVVLLYYLDTADGSPLADRWVSFRELPGGAFYHQAFQGYSGDQLAKAFASDLDGFQRAARTLGGDPLTGLGEFAYAFQPLPRLRLAAILWPGDDEFPTRAAILFDASATHYMVLDGLAILGSRLVSRLVKAR